MKRSNVRSNVDFYKVFVGGIPQDSTKPELSNYFSKFGEIETLILPRGTGGRIKGFCIVKFSKKSSASDVIAQRELNIGGKLVSLRECLSVQEAEKQRCRYDDLKVFISGFLTCQSSNTEQLIKAFFSNFGEIEHVRLIMNPSNGDVKGFGYIKASDKKTHRRLLKIKHFNYNGQELLAEVSQQQYQQKEEENREREFRSSENIRQDRFNPSQIEQEFNFQIVNQTSFPLVRERNIQHKSSSRNRGNYTTSNDNQKKLRRETSGLQKGINNEEEISNNHHKYRKHSRRELASIHAMNVQLDDFTYKDLKNKKTQEYILPGTQSKTQSSENLSEDFSYHPVRNTISCLTPKNASNIKNSIIYSSEGWKSVKTEYISYSLNSSNSQIRFNMRNGQFTN